MFELDEDIQLEALPAGPTARFQGRISDRWNIGPVPNGGYVMAIAAEALRRSLPFPDPLTITGLYVDRAEPGPVEIEVEVLRSGRSQSSALVRLVQDDRLRAHFSATFADLDALDGPNHIAADPPQLPPIEEGVRVPPETPGLPEIMRRFDMRCPPAVLGWTRGATGAPAEIGGWLAFADGRPPDARSLVLVADAFPPAIFPLWGMAGWVPTLELTVHVRRRPALGPLACWFRTRFVTNGCLEEDGEIWDSSGQLVAQSRQLARLLGPRR